MDNSNFVPFKIYLLRNDSTEAEIRRFGLQPSLVTSYNLLVSRITEIFPRLSDQVFTVYWKDEEGDEVAISSDEELIIALTSIKSELKTFFVKIQASVNDSLENEKDNLHPGVYCDGCNCNIAGFRFKCLECKDYDLCSLCEHAGIHSEHVMLRFTNRFGYDHIKKLRKIAHAIHPFIEVKHPRRKHSHDGGRPEYCKKKKRCDKRESGPDTGDESSEDGNHKKCRKYKKCPYGHIMSEVFNYFNPIPLHVGQPCETSRDGPEKSHEDAVHNSYLRSVGLSLQKLLDPLGVSVEFEVRPGSEKHEEKVREEKKTEQKNEEQSPECTSSSPPQKEVRFSSSEQPGVEMKQKIDEITKILANQPLIRSNSADNDGWVSFEELKKNSEESRPSPNAEVTAKQSDLEGNSEEKENQRLYPDLQSPSYISSNPKVNVALNKMLAMGFTNEKNWLTFLLEAKDGNIDEALEALSFQKKN